MLKDQVFPPLELGATKVPWYHGAHLLQCCQTNFVTKWLLESRGGGGMDGNIQSFNNNNEEKLWWICQWKEAAWTKSHSGMLHDISHFTESIHDFLSNSIRCWFQEYLNVKVYYRNVLSCPLGNLYSWNTCKPWASNCFLIFLKWSQMFSNILRHSEILAWRICYKLGHFKTTGSESWTWSSLLLRIWTIQTSIDINCWP